MNQKTERLGTGDVWVRRSVGGLCHSLLIAQDAATRRTAAEARRSADEADFSDVSIFFLLFASGRLPTRRELLTSYSGRTRGMELSTRAHLENMPKLRPSTQSRFGAI
jgi:hypothetical protein